jgi:hypothetical protein
VRIVPQSGRTSNEAVNGCVSQRERTQDKLNTGKLQDLLDVKSSSFGRARSSTGQRLKQYPRSYEVLWLESRAKLRQ